MARCPFSLWSPITGSSGPHLGGPFKIIHHTTEGSNAQGAFSAFQRNRSDPHFTVDATTIYQHIDTAEGARALRNEVGGVQTNRDSAVQIELVGFAHLPKDRKALINLARLCRWIEQTHGVPNIWPAGLPKPAKNGRDPGQHNRSVNTWDSQSGHYGHCHVPENSHWDPGYTEDEASFLMEASFDAAGKLISPPPPAVPTRAPLKRAAGLVPNSHAPQQTTSTMPDHGVVPTGLQAYVRDLALWPPSPPLPGTLPSAAKKTIRRAANAQVTKDSAGINMGGVLSFVEGVSEEDKNDVLYSVQLAQRAASGMFDRFTQTQFWYQKYTEVLQALGWASEQFSFSLFKQDEGEFRMDQAALGIITAVATQNQLAVLKQAVDALSELAEDDGPIVLFDFHSSVQSSGNFQLGAVQRTENGAVSMALGSFYFHAVDGRRRFLFLGWGARKVQFWSAAQRMTLNKDFYARRRADVIAKLDADAKNYIADLKITKR
ncbi:N-acetylmuramoyl-L-alanine amidase [Aquabacterium sp. CECT 9606]|uniref:N-acetylmuramoyl-L-alanine amidase n=1 Tax=Aquabacterium sp. CECT 9606 TaxID=2845822 RepID=UPI001E5EB418|nr:N-acetylmuramoyl-L-alanine amidase [Aquabacterium sp. CECT 9606]CAH0353161.1 hypothetical protein AQB9606_03092 [Aquabacterium sp. CECT 9606]